MSRRLLVAVVGVALLVGAGGAFAASAATGNESETWNEPQDVLPSGCVIPEGATEFTCAVGDEIVIDYGD